MKPTFWFLVAVLLLGSVTAQPVQNVFVVVIDGLRDMEGFEAPQWHADTMYLQHIWNDLRPQGTINTRFWNRGWTATTGGHTTIACGVRQILNNNGTNAQFIRSFDPLMFEYYRKQFNAPEQACGVIVGKWGNVGEICNFGLEPSFGEPVEGFQLGDTSTGDDTTCSKLVHQAMDSLHPRLVLVNLGGVDHMGHIDSLGGAMYYPSIRLADSIVYQFWKHIQADSPYSDTFYRNRTVLIVTSDHGRHDDAHGSWSGHGNWDHGSRHTIFLALGPDIAANRVVDNTPRDHIDIVPTIAQMLGFPAQFAEGQVMTELFGGRGPGPRLSPGGPPIPLAFNLSNNSGFSRDPDIARDRNGNLYCVWSDNTPGKWSVQYRKSPDNGANWMPPQTLFDFPGAESTMWYARIAADDSLAVCAMGYGKHANWLDSARTRRDTTFIWYPWIATSADAGASWKTTSLLDSNMGSYYAPVTVKNGRYSVGWWACGQFTPDTNSVQFNRRGPGGNWRSTASNALKKQSPHVSLADDGSTYHLVASCFQRQNWNIAYCRSANGDSWGLTWVVNDPQANPVYDYDPEMVGDDSGVVHVVWARKPNVGGTWQVMYGRRNPGTGVFDTFRLTSSSAGAWQPHLARKGDTLALVWVDYRDGNAEIYAMLSSGLGRPGTWGPVERITYTDAISHHPRVAPIAQGFYVVWQDLNSGNWDVYGRQISFPAGSDCGIIQINGPNGSLDSTAIITPFATFRNFGTTTASFPACFQIKDSLGNTVYLETAAVTDIGPGQTETQAFPLWPKPYGLGRYSTWCWFSYLGDTNRHNDTMGGSFTISPPPPAWRAKASYPAGPRGKNVKDGCCLAYMGRQTPMPKAECRIRISDFGLCSSFGFRHSDFPQDTDYIYSLKGNGTCEFYAYNVGNDFWVTRESIPAYNSIGRKKTVKKGSTIAGTGGRAYAAKGNGTLDWWEYDPNRIGSYPWQQKHDVPLGAKTLKEGTGAAVVTIGDTTYVYLLKGSNTAEFYRYNTASGVWQTLTNAPTGLSGKNFRNGSALAYDGGNVIYALKGSYNEFYAYRVDSGFWATEASLPMTGSSGRKKRVKDGAGLAFHGHEAYALKGGNTLEFWKYFADSERWQQLEDMPVGGGRRVKGGGALVHAASNNALYATKGNNTLEFYNYYPLALAYGLQLTANGPENTQSGSSFRNQQSALRISPNPFSGATTIRYALPRAGNATLNLYDITGQLVTTLVTGYHPAGTSSLALLPSSLSAGIYVLRFESDNTFLTRNLIIFGNRRER